MEMKNVFSGLGAKLALALLAVGTMTSCYEKEELNVEKTDDPIDPVYYIQGNVCDVETGKPLEAKVTIKGPDGSSVYNATATNGYFKYQTSTDGTYTVEADCDYFFTASKTVFFPAGNKNTVSVATVDFALVSLNSPVAPAPDDPNSLNTPSTREETEKMKKAAETDLMKALDGVQMSVNNIEVGDGEIIVSSNVKSVSGKLSDKAVLDLPLTKGFVSTITPETSVITRATEGREWIAYAAKALGREYGFEPVKGVLGQITFPGRYGYSIAGYDVKAVYAVRTLSFEGKEGVVMYQEKVIVTVKYEAHDMHDGHDRHDYHDSHDVANPEAGGGDGNMGE